MASKKISQLDAVTSLDGTETIPVVQGGRTKSAILDDIRPMKRTPAEIAAGVTVVDYRYPEGHLYRYGTNTTPGTTDMTVAMESLLSWWKSRISAEAILPADKILINAPLSVAFTTTQITGKTITGYGAEIIAGPGIVADYMLTISSSGIVRQIRLRGFTLRGSIPGSGGTGNEAGCLKLVGAPSPSGLYGLVVQDVYADGFRGNGFEVVGNAFETNFINCQARTTTANTTGYGFWFRNDGSLGIISSIDLWGCMTDGGKHGVFVDSPVSDVHIHGGTYLRAQEEGILIENAAGSVVLNAHVENNWQSAADIASGGAGIRVVGRAVLSGIYGTTVQKQKYVVSLNVGTGLVAQVIGGHAGGSTSKFAYLDGDTGSQVWLFGAQTYDIDSGSPVLVNQVGDGITIGAGESKGRVVIQNDGADFNTTFYRWSGSGTSYAAHRIEVTGSRMNLLSATATAGIGSETFGSPALSLDLNNKLSFYSATPVAKPTVTGATDADKIASVIAKLETLGLIVDGTT